MRSARRSRRILVALSLCASLPWLGCGHGRGRANELAYISAPEVMLRNRVAPVYTKLGSVKNGERVEVLDRERRFLKVRTARGVEGWIEQRYTISRQTYDQIQKLAQDTRNDPVEAVGTTRNDTNIHLEPGRESEHLYQLSQGAKVQILKRATSGKPPVPAVPVNTGGKKEPPKPVMEDWWLIRDSGGRAGWVLARMVDVDVPLDIAQYAEGQRIQAFFILHEVEDRGKKVPEYLVLLSEPRDGMPFDYDQVRVFTWNLRRHRYETAYRERNLEGFFPVRVRHENFGKEGDLPVFILEVHDVTGNLIDRKYKLNTPIVRRVFAAGEVPPPPRSVRRRRRKAS